MSYSSGRCIKCGKTTWLKNGKCKECNAIEELNPFADLFGGSNPFK